MWPGAEQLQAGEAHLGGVRVGRGRVGLDPCGPKHHALVHAAVAALTVREEAHAPLLLAPQAGCSLRGGRPPTDSCACDRGRAGQAGRRSAGCFHRPGPVSLGAAAADSRAPSAPELVSEILYFLLGCAASSHSRCGTGFGRSWG